VIFRTFISAFRALFTSTIPRSPSAGLGIEASGKASAVPAGLGSYFWGLNPGLTSGLLYAAPDGAGVWWFGSASSPPADRAGRREPEGLKPALDLELHAAPSGRASQTDASQTDVDASLGNSDNAATGREYTRDPCSGAQRFL
jgi:hypothetical protein